MKYPLTSTTVNPNGHTAVAAMCERTTVAPTIAPTLFGVGVVGTSSPTMIEPGSPGRKVKLP